MQPSENKFTSIPSFYKSRKGRILTKKSNLSDFKNAEVYLYDEGNENHWIFIIPKEGTTLKALLEDANTLKEEVLSLDIKANKNTFICFLSLDIGTGFDTSQYLEEKEQKENVFKKIQTQADMAFNKFKLAFFKEKENKFFKVNFINEVIPYYFV